MLRPSSGIATINGYDVATQPAQVRHQIGFVSANTAVYDRMTAYEMVLYFGRLFGVNEEVLRDRIETIFQWLQMAEIRDRLGSKMSTGMKQKVSIARALVHDPPVLVFDEATSGLDVLAARALLKTIGDLRDQGKCVIFSTHIMREVEKLCNRIAIMHRGAILAAGTLPQLLEMHPRRILKSCFFQLIQRHEETVAAKELQSDRCGADDEHAVAKYLLDLPSRTTRSASRSPHAVHDRGAAGAALSDHGRRHDADPAVPPRACRREFSSSAWKIYPTNPALTTDNRFHPDLTNDIESQLIPIETESLEGWNAKCEGKDAAAISNHLKDRNCDAAIIVTKEVASTLKPDSETSPSLPVYWSSASERSVVARQRIERVLERWRDQVVRMRLVEKSVSPATIEPFTLAQPQSTNVAKKGQDKATMWAKLLPFVVFVWALTGAFYPAIDLCAGEKERGTLETLLSSPALRGEIVWGKMLTIMTFSLATSLLNLVSLGATGSVLNVSDRRRRRFAARGPWFAAAAADGVAGAGDDSPIGACSVRCRSPSPRSLAARKRASII